ncbi:MAG: fatty acid desaturase [Cognatishimia sp.]|uniref:fatty acid desaturase n=1 Tax=Cognatishimia sp. TaxID=2211648 RepID=UPI003B8B376D
MDFASSDSHATARAAQDIEVAPAKAAAKKTERRYKRGYDTQHLSADVRATLKSAEGCRPWARIREATLTVASIPAMAALTVAIILSLFNLEMAFPVQAGASILTYLLACVVIARQLRGLEIMVHDASHLTWVRSSPKLNHFLADLFVGAPVLSSVKEYWKSHRIHHGQYGSHKDPCLQRFTDMGVTDIDLSTHWKIARAVVAWLPSYNAAYYREIGSQSTYQWTLFIAWHFCVLVAPLATLLTLGIGFELQVGMALALFGWVIFWVLPAMVFLPIIRSIAETEEHDYEAGETEFETTFTNDGFLHRLLIHPKNDAYHVIHHLFPNIPEAEHHWVHTLLMEQDEKYSSALRRGKLLNVQ